LTAKPCFNFVIIVPPKLNSSGVYACSANLAGSRAPHHNNSLQRVRADCCVLVHLQGKCAANVCSRSMRIIDQNDGVGCSVHCVAAGLCPEPVLRLQIRKVGVMVYQCEYKEAGYMINAGTHSPILKV
jgi:hypothetical protein